MCRWVVYYGKKVLLADVVTRPENSIVHQSQHSPYLPFTDGDTNELSLRNAHINGDGFGVAWFSYREPAPEEGDNFEDNVDVLAPCVFTSIRPSWNDRNLQRLALHIRSHCIFSHVRAASPGSLIVESNCHPFQFGKLLFMHNGAIAHFPRIKYKILNIIADTTASYIQGTTDSEYAGALFVHYLPERNPTITHTGKVMKKAMLKMITHLMKLVECEEKKRGILKHEPSSLNFSVSDGVVVIATRFRDSCPEERSDAPSLYYAECQRIGLSDSGSAVQYKWKKSECSMKKMKEATATRPGSPKATLTVPSAVVGGGEGEDKCAEVESVVIASEPLYRTAEVWNLVPNNHLLVVTPRHRVIVEPICLKDVLIETTKECTALCKATASACVSACEKDAITPEEEKELESEKAMQRRKRKKIRQKSSLALMACAAPAPIIPHDKPREKIPIWGIDRDTNDTIQEQQQKENEARTTKDKAASDVVILPSRPAVRAPSPPSSAPRYMRQPSTELKLNRVEERQAKFKQQLAQGKQEIGKLDKKEKEEETETKKPRKDKAALVIKVGSLPFFLVTLVVNILLMMVYYYYVTVVMKA